jgi:predicted regulator of Ras-like GTPase activity (Roadblock/LC7/MglB family)
MPVGIEMQSNPTDLMHQSVASLLNAPTVREVFIIDSDGALAVQGGTSTDERQDLIRGLAAQILPAAKRIARQLHDPDVAQSASLPEADLHILAFTLTNGYSLVVSYSVPQDPYSPPRSTVNACHLLRAIIETAGKPDIQLLSSLALAMESEIFIEYQLPLHVKETGNRPNLFDESYLQAQQKEVVRIARQMLSGDLGVVEGARFLMHLRPSVSRNPFDPDFLPFAAIASETDTIPIGKQRDLWAPGALERKDRELGQAEELHRPTAHAACRVLIKRFEPIA